MKGVWGKPLSTAVRAALPLGSEPVLPASAPVPAVRAPPAPVAQAQGPLAAVAHAAPAAGSAKVRPYTLCPAQPSQSWPKDSLSIIASLALAVLIFYQSIALCVDRL